MLEEFSNVGMLELKLLVGGIISIEVKAPDATLVAELKIEDNEEVLAMGIVASSHCILW